MEACTRERSLSSTLSNELSLSSGENTYTESMLSGGLQTNTPAEIEACSGKCDCGGVQLIEASSYPTDN